MYTLWGTSKPPAGTFLGMVGLVKTWCCKFGGGKRGATRHSKWFILPQTLIIEACVQNQTSTAEENISGSLAFVHSCRGVHQKLLLRDSFWPDETVLYDTGIPSTDMSILRCTDKVETITTRLPPLCEQA